MKAKFRIGDKVRFTDRANNVSDLRKRTRKIVATHYSQELQATLYELGTNGGNHHSGQWFRSYELYSVKDNEHIIGRPKRKIRSKVRKTSPNKNLGGGNAKLIAKPHGQPPKAPRF